MAIPRLENPLELFQAWFEEAKKCSTIAEPTAMTLATATTSGKPSARIVLLKHADDNGFVFYTNLESRKGKELGENPQAALCFYWMPLDKQVRVEGPVHRVSDEEADAYFASRPRESQLGAWASHQSEPMSEVNELLARFERYRTEFRDREAPRPEFWSGYRLVPEVVEFWEKGPFRLHDRLRYTRVDGQWRHETLYP